MNDNLSELGGKVINVLPIPEHEDSFKDKTLQYIAGPEIGLADIVERSVIIDGATFLIFKSGKQMSVTEANRTMIPVDYVYNYVPALQSLIDSETFKQPISNVLNESNLNKNTNLVTQNHDNLSPIAQILQKRKSSFVKLELVVELDLPSQDLFNILLEEFESTPDEIFSECLNQKNLDLLKKQLSEALLNKYCPTYKECKNEN